MKIKNDQLKKIELIFDANRAKELLLNLDQKVFKCTIPKEKLITLVDMVLSDERLNKESNNILVRYIDLSVKCSLYIKKDNYFLWNIVKKILEIKNDEINMEMKLTFLEKQVLPRFKAKLLK